MGVLITGLGVASLLRPAPVTGASAGVRSGASLAEALRSARFRWLYLFTLMSAPTMFIPFAHVSAAARDLGIDETRAVGLVGLIGIGSLVGRFAIGALADRLGRTLTLTLMQAVAGCVVLAVAGRRRLCGAGALLALVRSQLRRHRVVDAGDLHGHVWSKSGRQHRRHAVYRRGTRQSVRAGRRGAVFDRSASYAPVIWGCIALAAAAVAAASRLIGVRGHSY